MSGKRYRGVRASLPGRSGDLGWNRYSTHRVFRSISTQGATAGVHVGLEWRTGLPAIVSKDEPNPGTQHEASYNKRKSPHCVFSSAYSIISGLVGARRRLASLMQWCESRTSSPSHARVRVSPAVIPRGTAAMALWDRQTQISLIFAWQKMSRALKQSSGETDAKFIVSSRAVFPNEDAISTCRGEAVPSRSRSGLDGAARPNFKSRNHHTQNGRRCPSTFLHRRRCVVLCAFASAGTEYDRHGRQ